jgi:hypothetical protein
MMMMTVMIMTVMATHTLPRLLPDLVIRLARSLLSSIKTDAQSSTS